MSSKTEKMPWMGRRTHNTVEQQELEIGSKTLLKSKAKVSWSGNHVTFP